ncbi:MAG: aminotransferase class IV, partial [Gammaproteobacteria bacterium]|nr:aminotransferase class IV [Gammaproteobacteria bacterium]
RVSVLDRGFIFGDAVYEVLPVVAGRMFALEEHLERLARSLAATGIAPPLTLAAWRDCLAGLITRNGGGNLSVYLQVTRGVAPRDHAFPSAATPTVFAMCRPLTMTAGISVVNAVTLPDNRWLRCDIKSTSLLANVLLRNEALRCGAYEALLLRDGWLTEGAASNVFVVSDGVVRTPPLSDRLLAGVTRGLLLEVMGRGGRPCREEAIDERTLRGAGEIWITSSSRDLLCVGRLDGVAVGDGANYPVASAVLQDFITYRDQRLGSGT